MVGVAGMDATASAVRPLERFGRLRRSRSRAAVVSGHAVFTVDGQDVDAPVGTLVFVRDPAVIRQPVP